MDQDTSLLTSVIHDLQHCYTLSSSFTLGILAIWSCTGQMPLATSVWGGKGEILLRSAVADTLMPAPHLLGCPWILALMALPWEWNSSQQCPLPQQNAATGNCFSASVSSKAPVKGSARELNKSHVQRRARWSPPRPHLWNDNSGRIFVSFSENLIYWVLVNSSDLYSTPFHTFLSQYFNFITPASWDYLPK